MNDGELKKRTQRGIHEKRWIIKRGKTEQKN